MRTRVRPVEPVKPVRHTRKLAQRAKPAQLAQPASIWRLLDANANRAREGLRVVEDTARFLLNDSAAAKAMRGLRHDLDALVRRHYKTLLKHRSVETDSGRANRASTYREGTPGLLAANFKRAEEALRVLEEYGRVLSAGAVKKAQAIRFQIYRWEKRLHERH